jgi:hypothetical protein
MPEHEPASDWLVTYDLDKILKILAITLTRTAYGSQMATVGSTTTIGLTTSTQLSRCNLPLTNAIDTPKGTWKDGCRLLSTDGQHLTISCPGEGACYDRALALESF